MKNKLTRKGFVSWLRAKHPRTKVGYSLPGFHKECPLGNFLGMKVLVSNAKPLWAKNFIRAVDTVKKNTTTPITAKQALALLGE